LLFTEAEWNDALPGVVEEVSKFLSPYRTAIYQDHETHGEGWGSGSYVRLNGKVFILTNYHVAAARQQRKVLTHQFNGQEDIRRIAGDHVAYPAPLDLALLPVDMRAWSDSANMSKAVEINQIALAHNPVTTELLTFIGFAGERVKFYFDTLIAEATCYTGREIELPHDDRFSSRFHFGMDYRPDRASCVIGNNGLPLPLGFSGSTVWDTGFVAAKIAGIQWKPEMAKVTGVIWGWPSSYACLVATRAEYLRSFLLEALSHGAAC
jgi:Trypsin-like peptidase domain